MYSSMCVWVWPFFPEKEKPKKQKVLVFFLQKKLFNVDGIITWILCVSVYYKLS